MTTIAIRDLPESFDLDRQAMLAIVGGARTSGRQSFAGRATARANRIIDYPPGLRSHAAADAGQRPAAGQPKK